MQETRAFNGSTREETGAATGSSRTNIFSGKASEALLLAMLFSPHNSIWKATAQLRRPKLHKQLVRSVPAPKSVQIHLPTSKLSGEGLQTSDINRLLLRPSPAYSRFASTSDSSLLLSFVTDLTPRLRLEPL